MNVFRADRQPDVDVYAWPLRRKLPTVPIPLRAPHKDTLLNLEQAVHSAYENGRYIRKLRYGRPLDEPLNAADTEWSQGLLKTLERLRT